jgi:release factor glutamine methyltransferase
MEPIIKTLETLQESLAPVSQECARYESENILQHVLKCSRSDLYLKGSQIISQEVNSRIRSIVTRRLSGEPLAYILGSVFFYSMEISVNRDVLIPRQETEILVDTVLKNESSEKCSFIDLGTGSGAILAVLCKERPKWSGTGVDISPDTLKTARKNCPSNKVKLLCCDMFSAIKISDPQKNGFDFIVSNPPYISDKEMNGLDPSVSMYEPHIALSGGKDGMDFYKVLASEGKNILKPGGRIFCEIGCSQGEKSERIFNQTSWDNTKIENDLVHRPRVIMATCNYL